MRRLLVRLLLASFLIGAIFTGRIAFSRNQSANATPAAINYVRWTDPHEGAFNMVVPQGWHVIGGAYRMSPTDIRNGVTMMSPDGQVRIFVGDSSLGIYTEPAQTPAAGASRGERHQTLPDGTNLEVHSYMTGQQFANFYATSTVRKQCAALQIQSSVRRKRVTAIVMATAIKPARASVS